MKKDFRIWILGIFICCACSNDVTLLPPTSSGKPISFASSESATRAQLTTTANMNSMAIFAYHTAGDFDAATATPNYMFNTPVNKVDGVWTYSPVLFWPVDNSKLSFFAVTPAPTADNGISIETTVATAGYPTFKIIPPTSPTQQADFCIATPITNAIYDDPNGTGTPAAEAQKGNVRFSFSHAMSKINFKARYITSTPSTISIQSVTIESIEITGVAGSGEVKLLPDQKCTWTGNTGIDGKYILEQANGDLTGTLLNGNGDITEGADMISTQQGTLCLVPQTIPNGAQLAVYINIKLSDTKTIGYLYQTSLTGIWEAGTAYTYNIIINDLDVKLTTEETKEFCYASNAAQTYNVFMGGTYKIEIWGNQGGNSTASGTGGRSGWGGKGGYTAGEIELTAGDVLNIYVGQYNFGSNYVTGWNGGGCSGGPWGEASPGAGSIDVRFKKIKGNYGEFKTVDTATNDNPFFGLTGVEATDPRIIVGGGGGGNGGFTGSLTGGGYDRCGIGGYAGGLEGESSRRWIKTQSESEWVTDAYSGKGGTQTAGGSGSGSGSAGRGANTGRFGSDISGSGGGGGGWWGGGAGSWQKYLGPGGGGGGSSHVHSTLFTNIVYKTGNETFLAPGGTEEVGHSGGGLVRITRLPTPTP